MLICMASTCEKEADSLTALQQFETTQYYDFEILDEPNLFIYDKWELFNISGGFAGNGHDLNFDILEFREYGKYGFFRNDSLLEYGKITLALQTANDLRLKIRFDKDENSESFFNDAIKYVEFIGADTLHLIAPCCDRYNYHFKRVE